MRRSAIRALLLFAIMPAVGAHGQIRPEPSLSGTFRPSGAPEAPVRRRVGAGCVVDLTQAYHVAGALAGQMVIDFRIFVAGDCAKPPGTYDEHWIAYGTYVLRVHGTTHTGALTYLATVKAGGKVEGTLTLGGELSAVLEVVGDLDDGYLSYSSARGEPPCR